jgi:hypothetical protein
MKIRTPPLVSFLVFLGMSACALAQHSGTTHSGTVPTGAGPGWGHPLSGTVDRTTPDPGDGTARDPREESVWRAAQQLDLTSD